MTVGLQIILIAAAIMVGIGLLAIAAWVFYTALLNRRERRLAIRKGLYRDLVSGLALRERTLLEPTLRQFETLSDVEALEAVLEEQARSATERPAWLLDAYDRLGLVDKYIERLRHAKRWRDRAFAAELLGRVGNAKAVPALLETVQATRTEDADVREIALRALARIADPRAVPPLVDALQGAEAWLAPRLADILARHGDAVVEPMMGFLDAGGRHPARPWAASVLGEVRAQRAFPVLVRALGDLDDEVRSKAATALGRLADPRAVPYLLENLLSDPAPFVRTRIAAALGQFDDPEVIDRLVRALGDSAWWVRMRSVEALEQIGLAAEGPLLVALDDPDAEIRLRAAAALERLGVPQRLVAMIAAGDRVDESTAALGKFAAAGARELLAEQLQHPSPAVRIAVVTAIRRAGRRDLAGELLISAAGETDAGVRAAALEALAALEVRDAVPVAVDHLSDPDERVRSEALGLLGRLGSPDMIAAVEARSGDPEPAVRAAAARALGAGVGAGADAIPVLRGLLHDPAPEVREQSARAVAQLELRTLAPAVRDLLDDPAAPVRRAAAEALGRVDDRSGAPALLAALAHAPEDLHQSLAEAIGRLDPSLAPELANQLAASGDVAGKLGLINALADNSSDASAPTIMRMVEDPSPAVRSAAIQALARIDDEDAAARARRALADPDAGVRAAALDTLVRLQDAASEPDLRERLAADPSPLVRERAALAVGLFAEPGGAPALLDACRTDQPAAVRAAAVLALGAYHDESIVARLLELSDETTVRRVLQQRLRDDPEFRLLGERLQQSHHTELRALAAQNRDAMELSLAEGTRSALDIAERMRLVSALRAFQGERSRSALLHVVRSDPSSDVRAAALQAVADMVPPETLLRALQRALGD
ncbi:MAG TPA: HEAT repeat domain-containing protein, partial [Gemmatimonadales bacterium]|nr:HEAT repeat domain-containing protein [Gemmatimonadales bacterium]